jgi:hypothetical protein
VLIALAASLLAGCGARRQAAPAVTTTTTTTATTQVEPSTTTPAPGPQSARLRPASTTPTPTTTARPAHAPPLGVFRGSEARASVAAFERAFGVPVFHVLDFVGKADRDDPSPWEGIDDPSSRCLAWRDSAYRLVLSVALVPNTHYSLAAGAAGHYDGHWADFARRMVEAGCPDVVLRLGWELNGRSMAWSAVGHEADFARYWRRVVAILRAQPGQAFRFDWCLLGGKDTIDAERAWPGADVVDYVGLDAYDTSEVPPSDVEGRWNDLLDRPYGLRWHEAFAARHGKRMSFPEWGLTVRYGDDLGGGDNPAYVRRMADWIRSHDVAYALYFDVDARDARHQLSSQFPHATAAFREVAPSLAGRR